MSLLLLLSHAASGGGVALQSTARAGVSGIGTLTVASQPAGSGASTTSSSATLTVQAALASQAASTAAGQATLTAQAQLAGTGTSQASSSVTLTTGSSGAVLQSAASASTGSQATLTVRAQLAAVLAIAQAQAAAALSVRCALVGSAISQAAGLATLTAGALPPSFLTDPLFNRSVGGPGRRVGSSAAADADHRVGGRSVPALLRRIGGGSR